MTYVKVMLSYVLTAITLAVTLPTESPHLHTLESTLDNQIYPGTPEIQFKKLFKIENDIRVDDLLQPLAESEETNSLFYKLETSENEERRKIWKVVTLPPNDDSNNTPKDLTFKLDQRKVIHSAPAMAVHGRGEPPPPPGYSNTVMLASSDSASNGKASVSSLAVGDRSSSPGLLAGWGSPHEHNGSPGSWTKEADIVDTTSGSGSEKAAAAAASTSHDELQGALTHSANENDDLDFFWSWEAILLVVLPAAWVVSVVTLCFLTRSSPGKSLLQKLCPPPEPEGDAHLGHGIGFIDGSPGMRRRMTLCVEIPSAAVGIQAPSTEEQEEEEATEACVGEGSNGELKGKEITPKCPPVDDSWPSGSRGQAGLGPMDDYQRGVLRRLSLIQEEVAP